MEHGIAPHVISLPTETKLPSILLTSDGVHFLDKRTMELMSKHASDSALAMRRLIELAKWCGGHDNASAIILNLSAMELDNGNLNFGDIENWDVFGELRLVNVEGATLNTNNTTVKNTKNSTSTKREENKAPNPKPRRRKKSPSASKRKEN